MRISEVCPLCHGYGETDAQHGGSWYTCPECNGTGRIVRETGKNIAVNRNHDVDSGSEIQETEKDYSKTKFTKYLVSLIDPVSEKIYSLERVKSQTEADLFGFDIDDSIIFNEMTKEVTCKYIQENVSSNSPLFADTLSSDWERVLDSLCQSGCVLSKDKSYSYKDFS